jgi:hypothetical protein
MVTYFLISILTLIWHTIWIYIFHFSLTNIVALFQKFIMNPFKKKNSSIVFNMILIKVYRNMDNIYISDNVNVQYG